MNLSFILLDGQQAAADYSGIIMIVALILIFYFLMIRPQQKRQKELRRQRESMKEGDRIVTAGGIHGKIQSVRETTFIITIADGVRITIDKGSVYLDSSSNEGIQNQQ